MCAQIRLQSEMQKSNNTFKFYDNLSYLNCSLEDLAAIQDNSGYFDAIIMSEVVEHVANLNDFVENSAKLLKVNLLKRENFSNNILVLHFSIYL